MVLTLDEQELLAAYQALGMLIRLSIRCYLFSGDLRLADAIFNQIVIGLPPSCADEGWDLEREISVAPMKRLRPFSIQSKNNPRTDKSGTETPSSGIRKQINAKAVNKHDPS